MEMKDNIQWHPAFCSAMELELRENKKDLIYEREHNLSKMPLKIDFLVIKKKSNVKIKNEIGDFFLGNNILEYKSPGDYVNAGTFYKALSYACLYKAEKEGIAENLDADITISIVREQKPAKLFRQLTEKFTVTKKACGIYRISGTLFPMQLVITNELDKESHVWITALTRSLSRAQARNLLGSCAISVLHPDRNCSSALPVPHHCRVKISSRCTTSPSKFCLALARTMQSRTAISVRMEHWQKMRIAKMPIPL